MILFEIQEPSLVMGSILALVNIAAFLMVAYVVILALKKLRKVNRKNKRLLYFIAAIAFI